MTNPTYRKPLNDYQIQLIQTLYKFRFATTKLIASSRKANERVISSRLKILLDQDYIGRHYDNSYKLIGKSASYYLRPKAIRYLKLQTYANKQVLSSIYHDKRASDSQINHWLSLFEIYVAFKRLYPDTFRFYSKNELAGKTNLPEELPDARLSRIKAKPNKDNDFFLECYEDSIVYRRLIIKIRRLIDYAETDKWQKRTDQMFPTILLVCESRTLQFRVIRLVKRVLDSSFASPIILTILKDDLVKSGNESKWIKISDEDEFVLI
jgi:hypothetical protein